MTLIGRGEIRLVGNSLLCSHAQIYRFHIFNCEHGGYGCCFFVFGEKIDVPGSV